MPVTLLNTYIDSVMEDTDQPLEERAEMYLWHDLSLREQTFINGIHRESCCFAHHDEWAIRFMNAMWLLRGSVCR